jgi:hypothetical protein
MVSALALPGMVADPTAQALSLETAVTLFRVLPVAPVTFGLGTLVQSLPFQCSTRVCWSAESVCPTQWHRRRLSAGPVLLVEIPLDHRWLI